MESFCEYLVKIKHTVKEYLTVALIWLVAFFLVFGVIMLTFNNPRFLFIVFMAIVGIFYGATKLVQLFDVEYEMIAVNKDLDVDKIIAKSRRKRMITVHLDKVEEYGKYDSNAAAGLKSRKFDFKIFCANPDDDSVYLVYKHGKKGLCLVVVAVNEKLEAELLKYVPRIVVKR